MHRSTTLRIYSSVQVKQPWGVRAAADEGVTFFLFAATWKEPLTKNYRFAEASKVPIEAALHASILNGTGRQQAFG